MPISPFEESATFYTAEVDLQGNIMWHIKEQLKLAGWTITLSGDGIAAYGASDVVTVDSPPGPANTLQNTNAWFVARMPDGTREFLYRMSNASQKAGELYYSPTASFTGGNAVSRATAADEVAVDQTSQSIASAAGSGNQLFMGYEDVAPYRFYAMVSGNETNHAEGTNIFWFMLDYCLNEDLDPYVWCWPRNSQVTALGSGTNASQLIDVFWTSSNFTTFLGYGTVDEGWTFIQAFTDDVTDRGSQKSNGEYPLVPIAYFRDDGAADPDGLKGHSSIWTTVPDNNVVSNGNEYLDVGSKTGNWLKLGFVCLPWDNTQSTNPNITINTDQAFLLNPGIINVVEAPSSGAARDENPATIENLTPVNLSEIGRYDPIEFDCSDINPNLGRVFISLKYKNKDQPIPVFDGSTYVSSEFQNEFGRKSTVEITLTGGTGPQTVHFKILPRTGWADDIEVLRVMVMDDHGNYDV